MGFIQYRKQCMYACTLLCAGVVMLGFFSVTVYPRVSNFKPSAESKKHPLPMPVIQFPMATNPTTPASILSRLSSTSAQYDRKSASGVLKTEFQIGKKIQQHEAKLDDEIREDICNRNTSNKEYRNELHRLRVKRIQDICATSSVYDSSVYTGRTLPCYYYTAEYDFAYCKVPKCGSTFWTQAFNVLKHGTEKAEAILKQVRGLVHGGMNEYITDFSRVKDHRTPTILASRDPYSRLYSAYVDKIYLPNLFNYNYNIAQFKSPPDDTLCPTNNTFEDFLQYVVKKANLWGRTLDRHWAPIASLCRPCDIQLVILLKQESFSSDVQYVFENFKVEQDKHDVLMDALRNNRIQSTIPGIVKSVNSRSPSNTKPNKCMGVREIALRIWRSFQIQGYLKAGIPFPIFENELKYRNGTFYSDLIVKAIDANPMSREESKQQRQQFLEDAYRSVRPETIKGIQAIYKPDFDLFDYDFEPPGLSKI